MSSSVSCALMLVALVTSEAIHGRSAAAASGNPSGQLEAVQLTPAGVHVRGWALDSDVGSAPIPVAIYSDGTLVARALANRSRSDSRTGHGFDATYRRPAGRHTICVAALNIGAQGGDSTLGCAVLTFGSDARGQLSGVTQVPGGVQLSGWALDPDTVKPITVDVRADGKRLRPVKADRVHFGVGRTYPAYGTKHGYTVTAALAQGTHTICAYANNVAAGHLNTRLGCRRITLNYEPTGHLDTASRSATTAAVAVRGWALDPDTTSSIRVQVTVDGRIAATAPADVPRDDVNQARHTSGRHGYQVSAPANDAEHRVCVVALNVRYGSANRTLGCATVIARHPTAPTAPRVTARAGYGQATVSWTPGGDGGAPATRFTVRTTPGNGSVSVSGDRRQVVITGLAAGTRYTFAVTATNVAGTSPPGVSAAVTTPKGPAPQTRPAPISTSRYIRNINGTSSDTVKMRAAGAADAAHNPSGHAYLVLLDIGGQGSWGGKSGVVLSATTRFVTNRSLVTAMNAYVDGYASRRRSGAPAVIAIGTNNDMTVSTSTGVVWARDVVNPIAAHAARYHGITVAGANDIEPGFGASPAQTRAWLRGYLSATSRRFVFNGSADGCNWTRVQGRCNNGWTAADLYWLSGGAHSSRIVGLPQIYNTTMAQQWKYISLTGVVNKQRKINFGGPLTEWTACHQARSCGSLTGNTAWTTLWKAVRSDGRTVQTSLPYSTDLRIN